MVTLNHLGMVRAFSAGRHPAPGAAAPGRAVVDAHVRAGRGARGRPRRSSRRIPTARRRCSGTPRQRAAVDDGRVGAARDARATGDARDWSPRSARFATARRECVAVGGNGRVSLAPAVPDGVGPPRWTVDVDFEPRVDPLGRRARVGGRQRARGERDRRLRLGSARRWWLRRARPDRRARRRDAAASRRTWRGATAASPCVLVPGALCGIGRRGQLYLFDTRDGTPLTTTAADRRRVRSASRTPPPWAIRCSTGSIGAATGSTRIRGRAVQLEALIRHEAPAAGPHVVEQRLQPRLQQRSCSCSTGTRAA